MRIALRITPAIIFFYCLATAHILKAQDRTSDLNIRLKAGNILPSANAQQWLDSLQQSLGAKSVQQVIIQFHQLPDHRKQQMLKASGISLQEYVSGNAYIALVEPGGNINATDLGIRSITAMLPLWKMDERILNRNLSSAAPLKVLASFFKNEIAKPSAEKILSSSGALITDRKFEAFLTYEVSIPLNKLRTLASNPYVKYLNFSTSPTPLNDDIRASSGTELLQSLIPGGLTGEGVTVGIGDNISGIFHVDTRDRIINFHPWQATEHGSHVTGIAGGKGIMDLKAKGMAHDAIFLGQVFDLAWTQTPNLRQVYNMTLTNNSYAAVVNDCNYAGTYDQYSAMLDQLMLDHADVQHVFASGNDGLLQCGSFAQGFATVSGGYQPAKNTIVVGGFQKDYTLAAKSSRGPVKDGRLKPEIIALGWGIYSCTAYDQYVQINGTSMASPAVAGGLALLTEQYKKLNSGQNPRGDVLKALILNSATDMGNPGPDYLHGFGLLNVKRSVDMLNDGRYIRDSVVSIADNKNLNINVPSNTAQLKIMLYWHDAPASPTATTALVNDLDLKVLSASGTALPLILDPSAINAGNPAILGEDHLNNVEQVVINNPVAGSYVINVAVSSLPAGKQPYVITYEFIQSGITLQYPAAGVPVAAGDSIRIYWEASEDNTPFTIEYSDNGGGSWNTLASNVSASQRQYFWYVPQMATAQARVRISRGAQQSVSGNFVIAPQPVVQLAANQCPGYINITWDPMPGITTYEVMRKIDDDMQPVATTTATNYVFAGLSPDSGQYVAVRAVVNGQPGFRSKAVLRQPNDGACAGSISDNDIMLENVIAPRSGRKYTSSELTANEDLVVEVRNLDDVARTGFVVSYSVNGSAWQDQTFMTLMPAGGTVTASIPGLDLSAEGNYEVRVAIRNITFPDPATANDSMTIHIKHLPNEAVNINNGYSDGFEANAIVTLTKDSSGVLDGEHWDLFNSTDSGRVRTYVSNDVLITGQRSISMDAKLNIPDNQNYLTGTFNLDSFNVATTEARVELNYKIHGQPKFQNGNEIWARGSDSSPWISIYQFDTSATPGELKHTGSVSITDAFLQAGQDFSSSFQVRIGQHDTSVIAFNEYANGLTIDNFKLYSVKNDVQLLDVVSLSSMECGLTSNVPVTVLVYNSDNLPQYDVAIFYRFDNGVVVSQMIDTIEAKDTILVTFTQPIANVSYGTHEVDVWLSATGDTYLPNDSLMDHTFRNQPVIASYPYLENFEANDGLWFTDGRNSTWEYGVPNSTSFKMAASGTKVWATNLDGNYDDNEESYLYSPCFDISGLANPMLSFSMAYDIEDCGNSICDRVFIEYSADGEVWTRLTGTVGYNWYNHEQGWKGQDTRWKVASIALPTGMPSVKLRFVLHSDPGTVRDGVVIDDIHVFDLIHGVYNDASATIHNDLSGTEWVRFVSGSGLLGEMNAEGGQYGNAEMTLYKHTSPLNPFSMQYNVPRSFVVHTTQELTDSITLRLYIFDHEVYRMISDVSCSSCQKAPDAYRLGITKYDDPDKEKENGSLSDNTTGVYSYVPYTSIKWVPYEIGYYAEFKVRSLSEFWFNTGIPDKLLSPGLLYPNPVTNDQFNLLWNAAPGTQLQLAVFDVLGRKMHEMTTTATDHDNRTVVQLPPLLTGIYFVRYAVGNEVRDAKILVR